MVSKTPSAVWHCGTQHVPPLRVKGGDKCHHGLVSFRKWFGCLKSAYKDLEEGSKKTCNLMQINSVLVGFDGAGYT